MAYEMDETDKGYGAELNDTVKSAKDNFQKLKNDGEQKLSGTAERVKDFVEDEYEDIQAYVGDMEMGWKTVLSGAAIIGAIGLVSYFARKGLTSTSSGSGATKRAKSSAQSRRRATNSASHGKKGSASRLHS